LSISRKAPAKIRILKKKKHHQLGWKTAKKYPKRRKANKINLKSVIKFKP